MIRALILLLLVAAPAEAREEIIAGLSQTRISITANFDGSEILIFGAVKRETPIENPPLDIIVTVAGPKLPVTVRRKERLAAIWVNREAVEIDSAPSFYSVSTSGPIDDVLNATEDLRHKITTRRAIRSVGAPATITDSVVFTDALIRLRTNSGFYQTNPGTVDVREQTLFDTSVALPASLVEGVYTARIFLTRRGRVVAQTSTAIDVQKVGLERILYGLATKQPFLYGLLALLIAVIAGWIASAIFRLIR